MAEVLDRRASLSCAPRKPPSGPSKSFCSRRLEPSAMSVRKSVAEVRLEGWVYRESTYLDSVVNQRYGAIYPHALVTFRSAVLWLLVTECFCNGQGPLQLQTAAVSKMVHCAPCLTCGNVGCDLQFCSPLTQWRCRPPAGTHRRTCRPRCGRCTGGARYPPWSERSSPPAAATPTSWSPLRRATCTGSSW